MHLNFQSIFFCQLQFPITQWGKTPHFSTGQNLLKKILRKDKCWYDNRENFFDKFAKFSLCKKVNCKLHALSCVSNYMILNKRRILMKSFIILQFNSCPLIWMLHERGLDNNMNHIHDRALGIVYDDWSFSFEDLLNKDRSATIHQRKL